MEICSLENNQSTLLITKRISPAQINSINNTDPKKRLNAAEFYEATLKMFIENGGMECLVGAADVYTEVAQYLNETRHSRHAQSEYCASNRYC